MWRQYLEPIHVAVILFPLLAIAMAVPLFAYHYHRYGAISRWQVFVNYSFYFYLLCAYFLIILPLPSRASVAALTTPTHNFHPLLVYYTFKATGFSLHNAATWIPTLHTAGFQQPFFNIMLTIPFGFYLHYYFKRGFFTTIVLSFCLSLFFEVTQLTGLYGLYVRPYRLFDVDDLLLNTTGGFIGWLGAPLFSWLLPSKERIETANAKRAHQVGLLRRFTAFVIDMLFVGTFTGIFMIGGLAFDHDPNMWLLLVLGLLLFVFIPQGLFKGTTIGLRAVYLQVKATNWRTASWLQVIIRNLVIYIPLILIGLGLQHIFNIHGQLTSFGLVGTFTVLTILIFMVDIVLAAMMPTYPLLFERLSHTTTISSFVTDEQQTAPIRKQSTPSSPKKNYTTRSERHQSR
ncbi:MULTISPECIES: VanZ family protein [Furfurilactobacillus]|uniref:Teicoplanin resistance protein VanZ n=1 Tax=Furfurilactobacillus rossiae TaxID=231049 RepID=A0A7C9N7B4_9LACO|nr:VanZ family protein [Furfurilactobacillus milii]MYV05326.1 teicoplanin resistance protein VanZ [Furfurilactobacillus milii]